MNFAERFKYGFIRTPLQHPLMLLRETTERIKRMGYPEQAPILREPRLIRRVMHRAIRSDSNCVDVGCHYGSMLAEMVALAPNGAHVAFEPDAGKVEFLRRKFPEVDIRQLALSDAECDVVFYVDEEHSGYSGLANRNPERSHAATVTASTLDTELADHPQIAFMKIDVEGAEALVFKGGQRVLEQHRPLVLFECAPTEAAIEGSAPADCYLTLTTERGYNVYFLDAWLNDEAPVDLESFKAALVYPFKAFNWIAAPK